MRYLKSNILIFSINVVLCIAIFYLETLGFFTRKVARIYQPELSYFHGVVVNEKNEPIQGIKVGLSNQTGKFTRTNAKGEFILQDTLIEIYSLGKLVLESDSTKIEVDVYKENWGYDYLTSYYYFRRNKTDTIRFKR